MSDCDCKNCPGCGTEFTMRQIMEDERIRPEGMQFDDEDMQWNMFYFTHREDACGSTFVMPVTEFLPYINEPIPEQVLTGSELCEQHCLRVDDLQECHQPCFYAPFRRFLLGMLDRKIAAPPIPTDV